MGDDIGSGSVCFDFCRSAAQCSWVCRLWSPNDLRQQSVTDPKLMSITHYLPSLDIPCGPQMMNFLETRRILTNKIIGQI